MKWRHWSVLIVLLLLNYIIFSTAFTQLARQWQPQPQPVRTLRPTFAATEANPVAWMVLPTSTTRPTRTPRPPTSTPSPTPTLTPEGTATVTEAVLATEPADTAPPPTSTPRATATPSAESVLHTVKRGESLSGIAKAYGVTMQSIVEANDIDDPNRIVTGQQLIIPSPKQTPTPRPTSTANP
jgi:LysM repeat protein